MTYLKRVDRGGATPSPTGKFIDWQGDLDGDPFEALEKLGQQPLFWALEPDDVDGHWVATQFEDVRDILQDAATFSSIDSNVPFVKLDEPLLPSETDPPYTQKLRALLMPLMTAKKVGRYEERMRDVCTSIIESFRKDGKCDVVEQFSRVYPITIFLEFFGLSSDRKDEFRKQANIFLHDAAGRMAAWTKIRAIVKDQLEAKVGSTGDDLLSALANASIDGVPLDTNRAVSIAGTVFIGGLDTVPSALSWTLRLLARRPDLRRQIIETPAVIPSAVEECLRLFSVSSPVRRATRNIDFKGTNIVEGDRILCVIPAADRDVSVFGDEVDLARKANPHLTFATGPHRCLGSNLARHEFAIALEVWHRLIPDYRICEDARIQYSGPVFAMENLPLEWNVPLSPIPGDGPPPNGPA